MVKRSLLSLLIMVFVSAYLSGQSFYGVVKRDDSLSTPIFQAKVEVAEYEKPPYTYKTYFDGGYKFNLSKNRTYTIRISYPGYTDTMFIVQTDKTGRPSSANLTVRLKKDGMRLMGKIKSREDDFPIKEATIILKNVLTKEEDYITTSIDGAYNFKLQYETNYKVSIDKRSSGILNRFKDTSFYVSTIGFNQPLDYKLDIFLDPVLNPDPELMDRYNSTKQPFLVNTKPNVENTQARKAKNEAPPSIVEMKQPFVQEERRKETDSAVTKIQEELDKTKRELEALRKKEENRNKSSSTNSLPASTKKKKREAANLEVVVIRDEPAKRVINEVPVLKEEDKIKDVKDSIPR